MILLCIVVNPYSKTLTDEVSKLGVGGKVVVALLQSVPRPEKCVVFFDNVL